MSYQNVVMVLVVSETPRPANAPRPAQRPSKITARRSIAALALREMATKVPRSAPEFRALKGVGDKKAADLGPLFLAHLETWQA